MPLTTEPDVLYPAEPQGYAITDVSPPVAPTASNPLETLSRAFRNHDVAGALMHSRTLGAAFRQQNTIGSLLGYGLNPSLTAITNPDFDPQPLIPENRREQAMVYAHANNPQEVAAITARLDQEDADRRTLGEGGFWGVAAQMAAGALDPINLIPVGGEAVAASRGARILAGAIKTAAVGAGAMTAQEALLHATQVERTLGESALNVGVGTFAAGVLGGIGGAFARPVAKATGKTVEQIGEAMDRDLTLPPTHVKDPLTDGVYLKPEEFEAAQAHVNDGAVTQYPHVEARYGTRQEFYDKYRTSETDLRGEYNPQLAKLYREDVLAPQGVTQQADESARDFLGRVKDFYVSKLGLPDVQLQFDLAGLVPKGETSPPWVPQVRQALKRSGAATTEIDGQRYIFLNSKLLEKTGNDPLLLLRHELEHVSDDVYHGFSPTGEYRAPSDAGFQEHQHFHGYTAQDAMQGMIYDELLSITPALGPETPKAASAAAWTPKEYFAAPAQAPRPFSYDVSANQINEKIFYHGTNIKDLNNPIAVMGYPDNLYGKGFYITDSYKIAEGYSKGKSKGEANNFIYHVKTSVKNPLDMEAAAPESVRNILKEAAAEWSDRWDFYETGSPFKKAIEDPSATTDRIWQSLAGEFSQMSHQQGISRGDFDETFDIVAEKLLSAGYDSLTHIGGKVFKKPPHQVVIILDPEGRFGSSQGVGAITRVSGEVKLPVAPAQAPSSKTPKAGGSKDLAGILQEIAGHPEAGQQPATDFLQRFGVAYKPAKNTGSGTGYQFFVSGVGNVPFRRGDSVAGLLKAIEARASRSWRSTPAAALAGKLAKGGADATTLADELRALMGGVGADAVNGAEATGAALDRQTQAVLDTRSASAPQEAAAANQKANEAMTALSMAQTMPEYENAVLSVYNDPAMEGMPDAFWSDFDKLQSSVRDRLTGVAGAPIAESSGVRDGSGEAGAGATGARSVGPDVAGGTGGAGGAAGKRGSAGGGEPPSFAGTLKEGIGKSGERNRLKDEAVISRLPFLNRQDPAIRTLLSPANAVRRVAERLYENVLRLDKNQAGVASEITSEGLKKQYERGALVPLLETLDREFRLYRTGKATGLYSRTLVETGDALIRPEGKLTYQEFKEQVGKAFRRMGPHENPHIAAVVDSYLKNVSDPLLERAKVVGLLDETVGLQPRFNAVTGTLERHLSRIWDVDAIGREYNRFKKIVWDYLIQKEAANPPSRAAKGAAADAPLTRRSAQELERVAEQIIDHIRGTPEGRLPWDLQDGVVHNPENKYLGRAVDGPASRPFQERVFDIPDALVEDFIVNDIEHIGRVTAHSMAGDIALAERFGSTNLEAEFQAIAQEYAQMMGKAGPVEAERLGKLMRRDIRDLAAIRDRIRGVYGLPKDPNGWFVRAGRTARNWNYLTLMGGVMISSLADVGRPIMVHGLSRFLMDGLAPMVRDFKGFRLAAHEWKLMGAATDMVLDSRAMALAEITEHYGAEGVRGRLAQTMQSEMGMRSKALRAAGDLFKSGEALSGIAAQKMTVLSGLSPWTAHWKQVAGMMTVTRIMQACDAMVAGTVAKKELANLAASYIDAPMAARISEQFAQHGEVRNGIHLPNTGAWTDREAVKTLAAALNRDVDRIIVTPGVGDKPLFLSGEVGKLFGQFRSFAFASAQRVLLAGLQDRDLATLNGLLVSVGLGICTTLIHSKLSGRQVDMRPESLIAEGVDRSGVTAWLFDVNNMVEKVSGNRWGVSAILGKQPSTRYQSRNAADALAGPTAGKIRALEQIARAGASGEWQDSDVRAARRMLPFQNLWWMRGLFDQAERGVEDSMGIKRRNGYGE